MYQMTNNGLHVWGFVVLEHAQKVRALLIADDAADDTESATNLDLKIWDDAGNEVASD